MSEDWLAIDESLSENLVASTLGEESEESSLSSSSASLNVSSSSKHSPTSGSYRLDVHVLSSTVVLVVLGVSVLSSMM